jgi:hypothetical protein
MRRNCQIFLTVSTGVRRLRSPAITSEKPKTLSRQRYANAIKGFRPILRSRNGRARNIALETDEAASAGAIRQREWRRRRRANLRQRCGCCGGIFAPSRADQAFCGGACRQKGYRRRKAAGEMASSLPTGPPWRVFSPPGIVDTRSRPSAAPGPAERAAKETRRRKEAEAEALRKAIDRAHALIG